MAKPNESGRKRLPQVCVIPFRRVDAKKQAVEFCLITSIQKKRWIFPKGIIDPGESLQQTGHKEVWEEAGLRGELVGMPLGVFNDLKWGCELHVQVVLMEVTESEERWPESQERQREWVAADVALERLKRKTLKAFLIKACERLDICRPTDDIATC